MKTWMLGALAIILFIVLIGGSILLFTLPGKEAVETSVPQYATVSTLEQSVSVKVAGVVTEVPTSTSTPVGSTVTTSPTGRALVDVEGVRTVLDYDTTTTVTGTLHKNSFELTAGALWSRVQKLAGQGEFYQIETQNAVAVVRGTSFGVSYVGDTTTLLVSEGVVSFFARDVATGKIDEASEVKVGPGEKAYRVGSGPVIHEKQTAKDTGTPWYRFNNNAQVSLPPVPVTTTPSGTPPPPVPTPTPAALTLTGLSPSTVAEGSTGKVQLTGSGFTSLDTVLIAGLSLTVQVVNDTTAYVTVSTVPAGTYDVQVVDAKNRTALLRQSLTITAPPRPQQTQASPNGKP